jgi:tetratricopeptide (TPR) repeat protein
LSTNQKNNSAICLKASILRKSGDYTNAAKALDPLLLSDPLDFRAGNESYLLAKASGDIPKSERELSALNRKMRDFDQNYLELAVGCLNDGLPAEAEEVLLRFKGSNPIISYYLGYLADKKGNHEEASKYFNAGSASSVDYVFPFRLETVRVLETALKYNPDDSRAFYYLGNILYDKQPEKAIQYWEQAVGHEPSLAIAYRNLGWGYYHHQGDGLKAITAYEKAMALNKDEPVYYEELDALYEMSNASVEKRLKLFEGNNEVVSKRDDAFARQITVLTLAGKPEKAVEYLTGRNFSYREGSSRVRDIIIDAHLMLGKKYFGEKNYKQALDQFLLAQVPEEEAGGTRSGNRNLQVDYFIGLAYEASGNKAKARDYFRLSTAREASSSNYIRYYQGLSYLRLGKKKEAADCFDALIAEGEKQIGLSASSQTDFFAKFGEKEAENSRLSNAYMLKGLGFKGLGDEEKAIENLAKAAGLSAGNLYAKEELKGI